MFHSVTILTVTFSLANWSVCFLNQYVFLAVSLLMLWALKSCTSRGRSFKTLRCFGSLSSFLPLLFLCINFTFESQIGPLTGRKLESTWIRSGPSLSHPVLQVGPSSNPTASLALFYTPQQMAHVKSLVKPSSWQLPNWLSLLLTAGGGPGVGVPQLSRAVSQEPAVERGVLLVIGPECSSSLLGRLCSPQC